MINKNKINFSDFEEISLANTKKPLPLTTLGLMKVEKKNPPKSSFSKFYKSDCYHSVFFYKPISKIFSHI